MRVAFTLTEQTVDALKTTAKRSGLTMSTLVEHCIITALAHGVVVRVGGSPASQAQHTPTPAQHIEAAPEHTRSFTPFQPTEEELEEFNR